MIKPLRYYCQKVLPLVYDDSISYYETLAKTVKKLNEVIASMNELSENIDSLIDSKIAGAVETLRQQINAEISALTQNINEQIVVINQKITALQGDVLADRELINGLRTDLNNLEASLTVQLQTITARIDGVERDYKEADNKIYLYIITEIAKIREEIQHIVLADVTVTNPITGEVDTIQNTLDDIYHVVILWALSASEYDSLGLSAQGYDGAGLTAEQYDYMGKYYLMEKPDIIARCQDYTDNEIATLGNVVYNLEECCEEVRDEIAENADMFSPFRGVEESVKQVIYELAELARNEAVTAAYYDGLELTATDYDERRISAFNYDWHASAYLI